MNLKMEGAVEGVAGQHEHRIAVLRGKDGAEVTVEDYDKRFAGCDQEMEIPILCHLQQPVEGAAE